MSSLQKNGIWLLLAVYFIFGVGVLLSNPLLESPDELLNYENMRAIIDDKKLPVLQPGEFSKAHHPPLYYLIGALITSPIPNENLPEMAENINPFFGFRTYDFGVDNKSQYLHGTSAEAWPWRDAALGLYLLRFLSLVFGAGGILAVYKIGRILFAEQALALVAAAFVALNPMYLYIQSSVHNDTLTNFLAACAILSLVLYWQEPSTKRAIAIGVVCGLGILTKITFLFLGPVVLAVMIGRHFIGRKEWSIFFKNILIAGLIVVALSGWWFVRNQILYGEPTSMELQASIWQPRPNSPDWPAAVQELGYLRDSFWGAFGFGQIVFPRWVYTSMNSLVAVAIVGLVIWLFKRNHVKLKEPSQHWLLALLLIAPLTSFSATFSRMSISATANFGRYLFTSYGVLAILLAIGLFSIVRLLTGGRTAADWPAATSIFIGLIGLNLFTIFGVIRPVFAPPPTYAAADQIKPDFPINIEFQNGIKLLGYSLESRSAEPGEPYPVTLFWQAPNNHIDENVREFVQLVLPDGERLVGRDTLHGLGRYPTSLWQPGEVIVDTVPLYPPEDENREATGLRLDIGLKGEEGRPIPLPNGDTTLSLGVIRLAPQPPIAGLTLPIYTFGDAIHLIGVPSLPESVMAGEELPFNLRWQSAVPVSDDYVVLIHWVKDGEVQPTVQFDGPPNNNALPTSLWQPQDIIDDKRTLPLPDDLPAGEYHVLIGLYRSSDFARLPITDRFGIELPDRVIRLGPISVQ